jgi:hypothetical protein
LKPKFLKTAPRQPGAAGDPNHIQERGDSNMKWIVLLIAYLPVVLQTVTSVEATLKNVSGASKKQVALDIISAAAGAGEQLPEEHVQQISGLVL